MAALVLALASQRDCSEAVTVSGATSGSAVNAPYVGGASCRPCHEAQYAAWKGSDHDLAMQEATAETVLGSFRDSSFEAHGVTSTFSSHDGKFFVRTDGPDGALTDYQVRYTFGVRPLQQYLVEFPGGRLQALPLAWDSRAKETGGQRWFHLYPDEKISHDDQLHWTGLYQNWNLQCASCHSTNLRKNYDAATNRYATTWSDLDVACESCHGPGRDHEKWAASAHAPYSTTDDKGLLVRLRKRTGDAWRFATPDARYASQDPAATDARAEATSAMNTCGPCHARRSTVSDAVEPGAPVEDSRRLALLTDPLYFADGQQHDEVYTWGSFLQSKMHARGVTCTDCHDAHTLKTRGKGNALCSQCHNPGVFDAKSHHFHEPGSKGAECVECHMPSRNYMVIDARRDHSLRVPRPDLSATLGTPNACTSCHAGTKAEWAAEAMDRWYGTRWRSRPEYGSTLHSAATQGAKALPALMSLATDPAQPPIVRATAAELARPQLRPDVLPQVQSLLSDGNPTVRLSGVGLLEPFDAGARVSAAAPLLTDPARAVRIEAARLLADVKDDALPAGSRDARAAARRELVESLQIDQDWPAGMTNLGNFELREGRADEAAASFQRALQLDPHFLGAYANLADVWRAEGKDDEGKALLRRGIALTPDAAALHHSLGLLLVREGDKTAAVDELAAAARLDPDNARYAYVLAVGLQSVGRNDEALATLDAADRRHPYDLDILGALVTMNLKAGRSDAVLPYARKIAEVMPDDPGIQQLLSKLEKTQ